MLKLSYTTLESGRSSKPSRLIGLITSVTLTRGKWFGSRAVWFALGGRALGLLAAGVRDELAHCLLRWFRWLVFHWNNSIFGLHFHISLSFTQCSSSLLLYLQSLLSIRKIHMGQSNIDIVFWLLNHKFVAHLIRSNSILRWMIGKSLRKAR